MLHNKTAVAQTKLPYFKMPSLLNVRWDSSEFRVPSFGLDQTETRSLQTLFGVFPTKLATARIICKTGKNEKVETAVGLMLGR